MFRVKIKRAITVIIRRWKHCIVHTSLQSGRSYNSYLLTCNGCPALTGFNITLSPTTTCKKIDGSRKFLTDWIEYVLGNGSRSYFLCRRFKTKTIAGGQPGVANNQRKNIKETEMVTKEANR